VAEAGLTWQGPLGAGDSVAIDYRMMVAPRSPGESPWGVQSLVMTAAMAAGTEAELRHYVASATGEGELLVADARANPLEDDVAHGAVFRLEGPTREPVPIVVSEQLSSPVGVVHLPGSATELLVLDADAPGPGLGEGGLFRASTATGAVVALFQDSSLVEPVALALLDSTLCYLLDREADPLDLISGSESGGPGAIYSVDLETGTGRLVASDARFAEPVDLILDRISGMLYVVDRAAKPGVSGFTGGIFSVDPLTGTVMTLWVGDPFRPPRCGGWGPAGELLVVERGLGGGLVYRLSGDAPPQLIASCEYVQDPRALICDEDGRLLIADGTANPGGYPGPTGSLLRFGSAGTECQLYRGGPPFRRPSGLWARYEGTPVELVAFAVAETGGGIDIRWTPPPALLGSDFYVYRRMPELPGAEYALRNPDAPVHGDGELRYLDVGVASGTLYEYMLLAVLPDGTRRETHKITIRTAAGRHTFFLAPPLPNPMPLLAGGAGLTISFGLRAPAREARLALFDVSGRRVRDLLRGPTPAGPQSLRWDGADEGGAHVGSGVYFLRLDADGRRVSRRIVLVR